MIRRVTWGLVAAALLVLVGCGHVVKHANGGTGVALTLSAKDTTLEVTLVAQNSAFISKAGGNTSVVPNSLGGALPPSDTVSVCYGVKLDVYNLGNAGYVYAPAADVILTGQDGKQYHAAFFGYYQSQAPAEVRIGPGERRQDWLFFRYPYVPKSVQFTPDSGSANQTGEWSLK